MRTLDDIIDSIHQEVAEKNERIRKERTEYHEYLDTKYKEVETEPGYDFIDASIVEMDEADDEFDRLFATPLLLGFLSVYRYPITFSAFSAALTGTAYCKYAVVLHRIEIQYYNNVMPMGDWVDLFASTACKTEDWAIKIKKRLDSILN